MRKMKKIKEEKDQLFQINEIEGTPFMELKNENGSAAIFGKYQITEYHADTKALLETLEDKGWNITTAVMKALIEMDREIREKEEIINQNKKEEICK